MKSVILQLTACKDTFTETDIGFSKGYDSLIETLNLDERQTCEEECRTKSGCVGYTFRLYPTNARCWHYTSFPRKWTKDSDSTFYKREKCYRGEFQIFEFFIILISVDKFNKIKFTKNSET